MKRVLRVLLATLAIVALTPAVAAAAGPAPTKMRIAVPASAQLGEAAQVQAQVTDASGKPLEGVLVTFTAKLGFLEATSDVAVGDAKTDKAGIASTQIDLRSEGTIELTAVYAGDAQHAPSSATASMDVQVGAQLYAQGAGVKLPGFNQAPTSPGSSAALLPGLAALWPRFSGWPVAVVLMIIWSVYGSVVVTLFRITAASRRSA